jgi:hypothetical protein
VIGRLTLDFNVNVTSWLGAEVWGAANGSGKIIQFRVTGKVFQKIGFDHRRRIYPAIPQQLIPPLSGSRHRKALSGITFLSSSIFLNMAEAGLSFGMRQAEETWNHG